MFIFPPCRASETLFARLRHPWASTLSASVHLPTSQRSAIASSPVSELDARRRAPPPKPLACSLQAAAPVPVASFPALLCPPTTLHHTPRRASPPLRVTAVVPCSCAGASLGRFDRRSCTPPSSHPPHAPKREACTVRLPSTPPRSPTSITTDPADCLVCRACFAATASSVAPRMHTRAASKPSSFRTPHRQQATADGTAPLVHPPPRGPLRSPRVLRMFRRHGLSRRPPYSHPCS